VPFILYAPWPARSAEVSQLVNHQDILPTVLSLLRIDPGIKLQGYNLKSQLDWHPLGRLWSAKRTRTFCSTYAPQGKSNSFAVIEESLKVIKTRQTGGWRWEAYDLKNDPSELNDFMKAGIPQELNSRISGLQQLLNEFASEAEQAHTNRKVPKLDENQLEMLKDLGYIAN
jgi:arylsulfatase A-like enzyme